MLPPIEGVIRLKDEGSSEVIDNLLQKFGMLEKASLSDFYDEMYKIDEAAQVAGKGVEDLTGKVETLGKTDATLKINTEGAIAELDELAGKSQDVNEAFLGLDAGVPKFTGLKTSILDISEVVTGATNSLLGFSSTPIDLDTLPTMQDLDTLLAELAALETMVASVEGQGIDIDAAGSLAEIEDLRLNLEAAVGVMDTLSASASDAEGNFVSLGYAAQNIKDALSATESAGSAGEAISNSLRDGILAAKEELEGLSTVPISPRDVDFSYLHTQFQQIQEDIEALSELEVGDPFPPEIVDRFRAINQLADDTSDSIGDLKDNVYGLSTVDNTLRTVTSSMTVLEASIRNAADAGVDIQIDDALIADLIEMQSRLDTTVELIGQIEENFVAVGDAGSDSFLDAKQSLGEMAAEAEILGADLTLLKADIESLSDTKLGALFGDNALPFVPVEIRPQFPSPEFMAEHGKEAAAHFADAMSTELTKKISLKDIISDLSARAQSDTPKTFLGEDVPSSSAIWIQTLTSELARGIAKGEEFQVVLDRLLSKASTQANFEGITGATLPEGLADSVDTWDKLQDTFSGAEGLINDTADSVGKLNTQWSGQQRVLQNVLQVMSSKLPGGFRTAFGIQQAAQALPVFRTALLGLGVTLGIVAAAATGVGLAIKGITNYLIEMDLETNKIETLDKTFGDVEAVIDSVQAQLENRVDRKSLISSLFNIKKGDVLANTEFLDEFADVIYEKARDMGAPFEEVFANAANAVSTGNTAYLEQIGLLENGAAVVRAYADSLGISTSELSKYQIQAVIANQVIAENQALISSTGDSLPIDRWRDANQELKKEIGELSAVFKEWFAVVFSDEIDAAITFWENRVEILVNKLDEIQDRLGVDRESVEEFGRGDARSGKAIAEEEVKAVSARDRANAFTQDAEDADTRWGKTFNNWRAAYAETQAIISEAGAAGATEFYGDAAEGTEAADALAHYREELGLTADGTDLVATATDGWLEALNKVDAGTAAMELEATAAAEREAATAANQLAAEIEDVAAAFDLLEGSSRRSALAMASSMVDSLGIAGSFSQAQEFADERTALINATGTLVKTFQESGGEYTAIMQAQTEAVFGLQELSQGNTVANINAVGDAGVSAAERIQEAFESGLGAIIDGILKPTTDGLIPDDTLTELGLSAGDGRQGDDIDENARRLADVAVSGYQSQHFAALKELGIIPDDIIAKSEDEMRKWAATMVKAHTDGIEYGLYDRDAIIAKVQEQLAGKSNRKEFIDGVIAEMEADGTNVDNDVVMRAMGIDVDAINSAEAQAKFTASIDELTAFVKNEILGGAEEEGIETNMFLPFVTMGSDEREEIKGEGTDAAVLVGDALVKQAGDGLYGEKMGDKIIAGVANKKSSIEDSGKTVADWWGTAFANRVADNVPGDLLDILVEELVPLIVAELNGGGDTGEDGDEP